MITGRQIRAARGLLNWDAAKLAHEAGITRVTVSRIETDTVQAQEKSLARIHNAFDQHGIEFTDGSGVRLKQQNVEVLEGSSGFIRFFTSVYEHLSMHGGTIVQSGVNEKLFTKYLADYEETYISQMTELYKQRDDITMLILVEEGDYNFVASDYATYRWQPKKYFSPSAFYVVGDRIALMSFTHEPAPLTVVIKSASLAAAYRNSFAQAWAQAQVPPARKAPKKELAAKKPAAKKKSGKR
jgi:transcriptional regulator with XRE-family HTH domain